MDWNSAINNFASKLNASKVAKEQFADADIIEHTKALDLDAMRKVLASTDDKAKVAVLHSLLKASVVGRSVGSLYAEVLSCMQTSLLQLKKLVYSYVSFHCAHFPELTMLTYNTFLKDCNSPNPIVRALAIRTLCKFCTEASLEYVSPIATKLLADSDIYVRSCAVLAMKNLYAVQPAWFDREQIPQKVEALLASEAHPVVLAAALDTLLFVKPANYCMSSQLVRKLLETMPECNETGQACIVRALAKHYQPASAAEATALQKLLLSRLANQDHSLVLALVELICNLDQFQQRDEEFIGLLQTHLFPSLYLMLNTGSPEMKFVVLHCFKNFLTRHYLPNFSQLEVADFARFVPHASDSIALQTAQLQVLLALHHFFELKLQYSQAEAVRTELLKCVESVRAPLADLAMRALFFLMHTANYIDVEKTVQQLYAAYSRVGSLSLTAELVVCLNEAFEAGVINGDHVALFNARLSDLTSIADPVAACAFAASQKQVAYVEEIVQNELQIANYENLLGFARVASSARLLNTARAVADALQQRKLEVKHLSPWFNYAAFLPLPVRNAQPQYSSMLAFSQAEDNSCLSDLVTFV